MRSFARACAALIFLCACFPLGAAPSLVKDINESIDPAPTDPSRPPSLSGDQPGGRPRSRRPRPRRVRQPVRPAGVPLAVALGRLHPNKAMDVLLKAAARIPDLWIWIAGEGPDENDLRMLARKLGIEERVRFLGWRTDRGALLKAADICVFPSRQEPFGNVVVEAWSYGVPLVTAASTGPAWLAHNGEDAVVVPVDDAEALANGITAVLSSRHLAQTLVEHGRNRIASEFSEEIVIGQYIRMFEEVRPKGCG